MNETKSYFFCGIGGSGMLPLALIVHAMGATVAGSDRTLDQGRLADKFRFLEGRGIRLFPQDGSGLQDPSQLLVTSAAIEETVPDVVQAEAIGAPRISRPELLARLFNQARTGIAVGGTSGKSTVTGMIGWILHELGHRPTVMNGAVMKNFVSSEIPFASALVGDGKIFVSEVDESDGSIALYRPRIALLNNISLDHKSLEELRTLFRDFAAQAERVVLNLDDPETRLLASALPAERLVTCAFGQEADLVGSELVEAPTSLTFEVRDRRSDARAKVRLQLPGPHNARNALAAIAAAMEVGVELDEAARALAGFAGLSRRLEWVGSRGGIDVIDDFAHNPDKIAATLRTLHAFPGRLLVFFQPHGFGPLRVMKGSLIECFAGEMAEEDVLILSDPVYFGGTTDRTVGSGEIVAEIIARGRAAEHVPDREACARRLARIARPGDRIVVMGARDDTLTLFARQVLEMLPE